MLTIKRLNQYYAESHTLWDIDLHVPKGKCTVLMGRNGVGKTTLLQCIMGLLATDKGQIQLDGKDISHCRAEERVHLGVGYVPQGSIS